MSGYSWVHCFAGSSFPHNGVQGGRDVDGATIYVGRARHAGDMLPAKVIPQRNVAYVCYGGEEIVKYDYEVLCHNPSFIWVHASNGNVPHRAVVGGQTNTGEPLYIGRVRHEGALTVGKVHCSHGCIYVPFASQEWSYKDYEVLTHNMH